MESMTNLNLIKCKIDFITKNRAIIPLNNLSMVQGGLYYIIAQTDHDISDMYHLSRSVKPWSFSFLKFIKPPIEAKKSGFSIIDQGVKGYFFLKMTEPQLYKILIDFAANRKILRINDYELMLSIDKVQTDFGSINTIPDNINEITVRLETPVFFYKHALNLHEELSSKTLLNYQCDKLKQLGIMNLEAESLVPYLEINYDDTKEGWGYLKKKKTNESIGYRGVVGTICFKIKGSQLERELIWTILYISEYTGIGTRTSMGFGHNTIISVK